MFILFLAFDLVHTIGTLVSLGILSMVAFIVFGLNVMSINVSPLNELLFLSDVEVESTPIISKVKGSFNVLFDSDVFLITFLFFSYITFVSFPMFSYPSKLANIDT